MAHSAFVLPKIDYTVQYSEMYRSRSAVLGKMLEEYLKAEGETREFAVGEQATLLIGCVAVVAKKPQIIKQLDQVTAVEPEEWEVSAPEYFLEDTQMERHRVELPEEARRQIVNGGVVGLIGRKTEKSFRAKRVVFPLEAFRSAQRPRHKKPKVAPECETLIVVPAMANSVTAQRLEQLLPNSAVLFYEGLSKKARLKNVLAKVPAAKIYLVPGAGDQVAYMTPYQPPSAFQLGVPEECHRLSSPAMVACAQLAVVFCNPLSVAETMRYLGTKNSAEVEAHLDALEVLVQYLHLSPCSPDTCPTYPMTEDLFVLQEVPDVIVVVADSDRSGIRSLDLGERDTVKLVVLSTRTNEVLCLADGSVSLHPIV